MVSVIFLDPAPLPTALTVALALLPAPPLVCPQCPETKEDRGRDRLHPGQHLIRNIVYETNR